MRGAHLPGDGETKTRRAAKTPEKHRKRLTHLLEGHRSLGKMLLRGRAACNIVPKLADEFLRLQQGEKRFHRINPTSTERHLGEFNQAAPRLDIVGQRLDHCRQHCILDTHAAGDQRCRID